jgi:hypothetical protein
VGAGLILMTKKILILGGYGNFGQRIAVSLAKAGIAIIIAGRNSAQANRLVEAIKARYSHTHVEAATFDVNTTLAQQLAALKPVGVINTCGPFQTADYSVAETCIAQQVAYIDLADGRDFVNGIEYLHTKAVKNNTLVVSGASTVPALSSAVLEQYKNDFAEIDSLVYGIAPAQKTQRGLATTRAILTYLGKPLKVIPGDREPAYGWQDLYMQEYPELGKRWMANCDIPDLDIFPKKYHIKHLRFSAGAENPVLHLGMWLLSWGVRCGLVRNLSQHAQFLLNMSNWFDYFGTDDGGMHILIEGKDHAGKSKKIDWFILAKQGHGPQIPCVPAIILAKKIVAGELNVTGAMPCVGMISLAEYMHELRGLDIKWVECES